jgi:hypothetical protein
MLTMALTFLDQMPSEVVPKLYLVQVWLHLLPKGCFIPSQSLYDLAKVAAAERSLRQGGPVFSSSPSSILSMEIAVFGVDMGSGGRRILVPFMSFLASGSFVKVSRC